MTPSPVRATRTMLTGVYETAHGGNAATLNVVTFFTDLYDAGKGFPGLETAPGHSLRPAWMSE